MLNGREFAPKTCDVSLSLAGDKVCSRVDV